MKKGLRNKGYYWWLARRHLRVDPEHRGNRAVVMPRTAPSVLQHNARCIFGYECMCLSTFPLNNSWSSLGDICIQKWGTTSWQTAPKKYGKVQGIPFLIYFLGFNFAKKSLKFIKYYYYYVSFSWRRWRCVCDPRTHLTPWTSNLTFNLIIEESWGFVLRAVIDHDIENWIDWGNGVGQRRVQYSMHRLEWA